MELRHFTEPVKVHVICLCFLSPRAALSALAFEATLTAVAAGNVAQGVVLTDADRSRLMQAAGRINRMAEVFT